MTLNGMEWMDARYIPTCTHCQEFNETFLKVAAECEARACGVKFVHLDATRNEHQLVKPMPTAYPQVHMFKAHDKATPVAFDDFPNKVPAPPTKVISLSTDELVRFFGWLLLWLYRRASAT